MSASPVIIIADPDRAIRSILRVEFSRFGCTVLLAANGGEVEDYASQVTARMVLLDVSSSKFSGYAACAKVRRQFGYERSPIVLSVHDIRERDRAAAEKAGATALLPKPYSLTDLMGTVRRNLLPDDPLAQVLPPAPEHQTDWTKEANPGRRFGADSGLSAAKGIIPIVRGSGVRVPLIRAT